ncbi:MAG: hypothetical protein JO255_00145 [Alphaproteobacteria bacterium]|nr:hypothetical protein [Alphaproteobacteria bacterium]
MITALPASTRSPRWLESWLLGLVTVVLLTPRPFAHLLLFNTHAVQSLGFFTVGVAVPRRPWPKSVRLSEREIAGRFVGVILWAGLLELIQPLVHRGAHVIDFVINAASATSGTAAAALIGLSVARRWASTGDRPSGLVASGDASPLRERQRFFIVSTGRTGSSLLSAILADAGADFGFAPPRSWDRRGGEMEHEQLTVAARSIAKANAVSPERPGGIARLRWTLRRSAAKRRMRSSLRDVRYVKVADAHHLVRPAFKLGYFPTVILSYRRFDDYAVSLGLIHAHADPASLARQYRQVLRMGLWLLNTFGGCVVGYEQLVDPADRS